jgi:hypothetical protein
MTGSSVRDKYLKKSKLEIVLKLFKWLKGTRK